jgi:hypothetical protein
VPWKRRRIDGVSIAGAVFIALALLALGLTKQFAFVPFAFYGLFVLLPALAIFFENRAVKNAGRAAAHPYGE